MWDSIRSGVTQERFVDYPVGGPGIGLPSVPAGGATLPFSRNQQTYYTTARVDAVVTQKVRVFASWLYQYQRENRRESASRRLDHLG